MEASKGADVLGHPGNAVAWLADFLVRRRKYNDARSDHHFPAG